MSFFETVMAIGLGVAMGFGIDRIHGLIWEAHHRRKVVAQFNATITRLDEMSVKRSTAAQRTN